MYSFNQKQILTALLIIISLTNFAQDCIPVYNKTYGAIGNDEALNILYTSDKGSIVVGRTTSGTSGDYDAFILKLSEAGNIEWSKNYGSSKGDDEFTKIVADYKGGYLVIGQTKSFGNINAEPLIIKIDNSGLLQWSYTLFNDATKKHVVKDLVQLNNDNISLLVNSAPNTAFASANVVMLTPSGALLWAKTFDNPGDDAFNAIVQQNDSLVIIGHATIGAYKSAILMKLEMATGNLISANSYTKTRIGYFENYHTDGIMVKALTNGLAITTGYGLDANGDNYTLTDIKMTGNGNIYYEASYPMNANYGNNIGLIKGDIGPDTCFVHLSTEPNEWGFPMWLKFDPSGLSHLGNVLYSTNERTAMLGLGITGNEGYIFSGYTKDLQNNGLNKVKVVKTDRIGKTGDCSYNPAITFVDTTHLLSAAFLWQPAATVTLQSSTATLVSINNNFVQTIICQSTYCPPANSFPDSCQNSFYINLQTEGTIDLFDTKRAKDGGYLAVGSSVFNNFLQPIVTKIRANGSVEWAKYFSQNGYLIYPTRIISSADGYNFALAFNQIVYDHYSFEGTTLIKMDDNGTVLWNKNYSGMELHDIIPAPDGGLFGVANHSWGSGNVFNYVVRINASGEILWKKEIHHSGAPPVYRNLYLEGNNLYTAADFYSSREVFQVDCFNAANGSKTWSKLYKVTLDNIAVSMNGISKIGNTLFVNINVAKPSSLYGLTNTALISISPQDGTLLKAVTLANADNAFEIFYHSYNEFRPVYSIKTSDNQFITAQQTITNDTRGLQLTKYDTTGLVTWSKIYYGIKGGNIWNVREDYNGFILTGNWALPANANFYDLYRTDRAFIVKVDKQGNLSKSAGLICSNENANAHFATLANIETFNVTDTVSNEKYIYAADVPLGVFNAYASTSLVCNNAASCSKIAISGPDTICTTNTNFTYTIEKNKECTAPLLWIVDTTAVKIIATTDSTLKVQFLKAGNQRIGASLATGCTLLTAVKDLYVVQNNLSLSLGPDTTICSGNIIKLSAGSGFSSYKWQDGAGDSTLIVNSAGTYFVTVKDACGAILSDTIRVLPIGNIFFSAGADTNKCNSDTLLLTATPGFFNYNWQPAYYRFNNGTNTVSVAPLTDTFYTVSAEKFPGCFAYDTIKISVFRSLPVLLPPDTAICRGDSVMLDAGNGFSMYRWNTGAITQQVFASSAATYVVEAEDNHGCRSADAFKITEVFTLPATSLGRNLGICVSDSLLLDAGPGMKSYLWNTGETSRRLKVFATGIYSVVLTNANNCTATDSALITRLLLPPEKFLPVDTTICSYNNFTIIALGSFKTYNWNTGQRTRAITITNPGIYWLQVTDAEGCTGRDSILVAPFQCMEGVFIPSAFTPNADGKNDGFKPLVLGKALNYSFSVFNRFGQLVFSTDKPGEAWDGKLKGIEQSVGAYAWRCTYKLERGNQESKSGTVTLIR